MFSHLNPQSTYDRRKRAGIFVGPVCGGSPHVRTWLSHALLRARIINQSQHVSEHSGIIHQPSVALHQAPGEAADRVSLHKYVDAALSPCSLVGMYSEAFEIEVVQATPADVGVLAPLFDAYRQFYKRPSNQEAARRFLFARLSKGESVLFYAHHGQGAEGFVHLYPVFSSLNLTRQWILSDLFVVPEARKQSVGFALMNRARQFAGSTQADGLMLETATDNRTAQRLYERLGWKRDEEFYRYFLAL